VLRDKPTPLANISFVEHPRTFGGFLASLESVLTAPIRGAIRLDVPTRTEGYLQPTKGAVTHHGNWVNVGYFVAHGYRVTKNPPVAKGVVCVGLSPTLNLLG
jgi:hypothetical protein